MSVRTGLVLIVVSLAVGLVVGVMAGLFGLEMPWWYWAIVGGAVAVITSVWEAYSRRKKALGQTEVEEQGLKSKE